MSFKFIGTCLLWIVAATLSIALLRVLFEDPISMWAAENGHPSWAEGENPMNAGKLLLAFLTAAYALRFKKLAAWSAVFVFLAALIGNIITGGV